MTKQRHVSRRRCVQWGLLALATIGLGNAFTGLIPMVSAAPAAQSKPSEGEPKPSGPTPTPTPTPRIWGTPQTSFTFESRTGVRPDPLVRGQAATVNLSLRWLAHPSVATRTAHVTIGIRDPWDSVVAGQTYENQVFTASASSRSYQIAWAVPPTPVSYYVVRIRVTSVTGDLVYHRSDPWFRTVAPPSPKPA